MNRNNKTNNKQYQKHHQTKKQKKKSIFPVDDIYEKFDINRVEKNMILIDLIELETIKQAFIKFWSGYMAS